MATIKEYYEKDFGNAVRMYVKFPFMDSKIEGAILYDFTGNFAFLACYIAKNDCTQKDISEFLKTIKYGRSTATFDNQVKLPLGKTFHGRLKFENKIPFEIKAQFFGDQDWLDIKDLQASRRIFIYSESNLSDDEINQLKNDAKKQNHDLQYRSSKYMTERSKFEKPLAFISHDSDDKEVVAKEIAIYLQSRICPVWYDEFSLKVGDNLRESIEKGLKECKKCILILSPSFLANKGWGKKEFDSIFTREIIEEKKLVLPVWYNVTEKDVYEYSPGLLNVLGLDWNKLGKDEVCKKLHRVIES